MVNSFRDFPPEKKDSKRLIEQLLMQETFSRYDNNFLRSSAGTCSLFIVLLEQ